MDFLSSGTTKIREERLDGNGSIVTENKNNVLKAELHTVDQGCTCKLFKRVHLHGLCFISNVYKQQIFNGLNF